MASPPPPPPPPPPPHHRSNSSEDYYYFVVTVVIIVIMLVVSNIIAFACCSPCHFFQNLGRIFRGRGSVSVNQSQELIPVSRYKKEKAYDTECSVCLTGFTEGEEVRQLPRCRHSFHAPCIDMWLYSHSSCPLCRAIVVGLQPLQQCPRTDVAREVSRQQSMMFTGSNNMGQMVAATI